MANTSTAPTDFCPIVKDPSEAWIDKEVSELEGLSGPEAMQHALCFDFDGVLHRYTSGWQGHDVVADRPVEGAQEACAALINAGWKIYVLTSRAHLEPVRQWLWDNGFSSMTLTRIKPIAIAYIDDRGIRFEGNWPSIRKLFA